MDDRSSGSFETDGSESYEWDYADEAEQPARVVWGRVVALVALLVLGFLFGRWTAPEGTDADRVTDLQAQNAAAQEEIAALEEQLTQERALIAVETAEPAATPTTQEPAAETGKRRIYVVKSGDTLLAIAQKVYGDSSMDDLIAEANEIDNPRDLRPGDRLVIPPKPRT